MNKATTDKTLHAVSQALAQLSCHKSLGNQPIERRWLALDGIKGAGFLQLHNIHLASSQLSLATMQAAGSTVLGQVFPPMQLSPTIL